LSFFKQDYKSILILIPLIFIGISTQSQVIDGQVLSNGNDVSNVHVLNLSSQRATITNTYGYFSISAKISDKLLFSAIQFKNKQLVVTKKNAESKMLLVTLTNSLTELEEVVVRPYLLSGNIDRDLYSLDIGPVISGSSLELPNVDVMPLAKSERYLFAATSWFNAGNPSIDPIINFLSGRTQKLKKWVAKDKEIAKLNRIRKFYPDTLFTDQLKIPKWKIFDFMYFCEADKSFEGISESKDKIEIWQFLLRKSTVYRKHNNLK